MDHRPDTSEPGNEEGLSERAPAPREEEEPSRGELDAAPGREPEEDAPFLGKLLLVLFPFLLLLALYLVDRLLLPDR